MSLGNERSLGHVFVRYICQECGIDWATLIADPRPIEFLRCPYVSEPARRRQIMYRHFPEHQEER